MKPRKAALVRSIAIVAVIAVSLVSCDFIGGDPPADVTIEEQLEIAREFLDAQDFDAAYEAYSQAILIDPTSSEALMGYAVLELGSISTDPAVRTVAGQNMGIVGYPDNMNDVFTLAFMDEFIREYTYWDGTQDVTETYTTYAPVIVGMEAFDGVFEVDGVGDGVIDPDERAIAMLSYFAANNSGFNSIAQTLNPMLEARIANAISAISALPEDSSFEFTWNMFVDTQDEWGYNDVNDSPLPVVIGKAELQVLLSGLHFFNGNLNLLQMYNFDVPSLQAYYDFFNPIDGSFDLADMPANPLLTFGTLNTDAEAHRTAARQSYIDSTLSAMAFIDGVLTDRAGFTLSSDGAYDGVNGPLWSDITVEMTFAKNIIQEFHDSFSNGSTAYLPVGAGSDEYAAYNAAWPTAVEFDVDGLPIVVAANPGAFFTAGPYALLNFVDHNDLNPVFYEIDGAGMVEVSAVPDLSSGVFPDYAIKIPGSVINNFAPTENYVYDDPTDPDHAVVDYWFNYSDMDGDFYWDEGEMIHNLELYRNYPKGLININLLESGYGSDPITFFSNQYPDIYAVPDAIIEDIIFWEVDSLTDAGADGSVVDDFRDAVAADFAFWSSSYSGSATIADPATGDIYLLFKGALAQLAALTLATEGTVVNIDGTDYTATGDFWEAFFVLNF